MDFRIVALLPAHNEAESIATTIRALRAQTRVPDEVIVICDNCTDATAEIASDHGATVWTTSGNTHKKVGALNYALARVLPRLEDGDAVLLSVAVFPEWFYELSCNRSRSAPCGRGLADQQVLVITQRRGMSCTEKSPAEAGSPGPPCRSPGSMSCTRR